MTSRVLQSGDHIAIINRGEPAVRFLNAVRDFNAEHGTCFKTVALYTRPDQHARFVQRADIDYCLGEALEPDPNQRDATGVPVMRSPYLIYDRLTRALKATNARAVWPGWGFVSEHAGFVDLCDSLDIVFIGPGGDTMRMLGDKIGSKLLAEKSGVAVSPWSGGAVASPQDAVLHAEKIGYPLVIKATAGGGGRGIRVVLKPEELTRAFESATSEAEKAFGNGTVFMEKMVIDARHLEVQIVADKFGTVWPVGIRDCSVQRRNQKVIEEGPAVILTEEQSRSLKEAAANIARASGYYNAGTAEFLYAGDEFYFMEMNTRLQVEHPVTEVTSGVDLVKMQIQVAMGLPLKGEPPATSGHAIEIRLNAEDPYNQFAPSPGKIEVFNPPGGPGLRTDSGVDTGSEIPSVFDSMVAKIIAFGATRSEALARLRRALVDTLIVIKDGTTNKAFLLELLDHPDFIGNRVTTRWLDKLMEAGIGKNRPGRDIALIAAGIEMYSRMLHAKRTEFFRIVSRGRPQKLPIATPVEVEMRVDGLPCKLEINYLEPDYYRIHHEGHSFDVKFIRDGLYKGRIFYNQTKYEVAITARQDNLGVEVDGVTFLVEQDSGGMVKSNSPAVVLAVHICTGQSIKEGDPLVTLEAMKMEMLFTAPASGRIGEVFVKPGVQVGAGDPMVIIEAESSGPAADASGPAISFHYDSLPEQRKDKTARLLEECHSFMMGFDVHHFSFENMLQRLTETIHQKAVDSPGRNELVNLLQDLCRLYFDIEFLFLKQVSVSATDISSPEQNFFTYLQLLRTGQPHPADDFVVRLEAALGYYDVTPYGPADPLEEALIHIFHSHDHLKLKHRLLKTLFTGLEECGAFGSQIRLKNTLERLINDAQSMFRTIYDMAVDCYYEIYEKATFDSRVTSTTREMDDLLEQLDRAQDQERDALIRKVAYNPTSMLKFFINRFEGASLERRRNFAEILLRRIHLEFTLEDLKVDNSGEVVHAMASYQTGRKKVLNITFVACFDQIHETMVIAEKLVSLGNSYNEIILDIHMNVLKEMDEDGYAEVLGRELANFPKFSMLSRVRFLLGDRFPLARCFHFHQARNGYTEKRLYRGISEMLAERFYLDRLQGFFTTRMPTEDNVNLFYCVANENIEDRRLIAFNEVREAAPPKGSGPFTYPALHREFLMVMKAMRHSQDKFGARKAFYWNQVIMYIRPLVPVGREEFMAYLHSIISGYQNVQLDKMRIYVLLSQPHGDVANLQVEVSFPGGMGIELRYTSPTTPVIEPLSQRDFRQALARHRQLNYPYETIRLLTEGYFYKGDFEEYDVVPDKNQQFEPISVKGRPWGENKIGMVFGIISNDTPAHPEGMKRVIILGDGNFGLGCLAEPECRQVLAALDLARIMKVPVEWFAISSGAKISMNNGTENLDWTARVLRGIIEFTQDGGEINIIVDGINVGAQSYWNAEATMLMHTRGCLIMTTRGCMVLTGKNALDYSGSVSAEDNIGIGGLQRIMGPNGQVQYPANDLLHACEILFRYYAFTYCRPGEKWPRSYQLDDPTDRNIVIEPYSFETTPDFKQIGDIFSDTTNPGKKKPFDMRQVMSAVADRGQKHLERWPLMCEAETAIAWDTTIGGICISLLGIQSFPIKRKGEVPNDGPDTWTGGTLFPNSSKKLARAINAASGRRPVVILANLSGFDGSPESLRRLQLEYGAEIGRAVVNFEGPIIFSVLSRYHGGAYVVFSTALNDNMRSIALEGTFASVIGGAPAAAVVFVRDVRKRALMDKRVVELQKKLESASGAERKHLEMAYTELYGDILREKQSQMAGEFEAVHSVQRAREVGSLHDIIDPARLRPYIIETLLNATKGQS